MKRRREGAGKRCGDGEPEKVEERGRAFSRDLGGTDGERALERGSRKEVSRARWAGRGDRKEGWGVGRPHFPTGMPPLGSSEQSG